MEIAGDDKHDNLFTIRGSIGGRTVLVLLDTGASASYVSNSMAERLGRYMHKEDITINLEGNHQLVSNGVIRGCPLRLHTDDGRRYHSKANLIATSIETFDVILGNDWLGRNEFRPIYEDGLPAAFQVSRHKNGSGTRLSTIGNAIRAGKHIYKINCSTRVIDIEPRLEALTILWTALQRPESATKLSARQLEHLINATANKIIYDKAISRSNEERRAANNDDPENAKARLMKKFPDVFCDPPAGIPPIRENIFGSIELQPGALMPLPRPSIRLAEAMDNEREKMVRDLLTKRYISPSRSPYASAAFLVAKPNGKWRFVVDFRGLNKITVKDAYPLPLPDELFERLQGAQYFSKIDLTDGFHQVPLDEKSRKYTAFRTSSGLYEYNVLAMGLCNSPPIFMRMMNVLFDDLIHVKKCIVIFVDDLTIYSKSKEEHQRHLDMVFERLRKYKLYVKPEKCDLFKTEITFLGHRISLNQKSMEPSKVNAIQERTMPTTIAELRSFLGLINYYRQFIPNFAAKTLALTSLTEKCNSIKGGIMAPDKRDLYQRASVEFEAMKKEMSVAGKGALSLPMQNIPYRLTCDASDFAMGAVLEQEQEMNKFKPIGFFSAKFNEAQCKYITYDKEMLAIVSALKHFKYLLIGSPHKVEVVTDHQPITHLNNQDARMIARWGRWVPELCDFNLKFTYRPGQQNMVADYLSRNPAHKDKDHLEKSKLQLAEDIGRVFGLNHTWINNMVTSTRQLSNESDNHSVSSNKHESVSGAKGTVRMLSQQCIAFTREGKQCRQHTSKGSRCWRHLISSEAVHVMKSEIGSAEWGLFARKSFRSGDVICKHMNDSVEIEESTSAAENAHDQQLTHNISVRASRIDDTPGRWINHSNNPHQINCKLEFLGDPQLKRAIVVATKDIKEGEELYTSYSERYWSIRGHKPRQPVLYTIRAAELLHQANKCYQEGDYFKEILLDKIDLSWQPPIENWLMNGRALRSSTRSQVKKTQANSSSTAASNNMEMPEPVQVSSEVGGRIGVVSANIGDAPEGSDAPMPQVESSDDFIAELRPTGWTEGCSIEEMTERIKVAVEMDREYKRTRDNILSKSQHKQNGNTKVSASVVDGLIMRDYKNEVAKELVIPNDDKIRTELLQWAHDQAGHLGKHATMNRLKGVVWWRGITTDVEKFVSTCARCIQSKHSTQTMKANLMPLPVPSAPWQSISVDFITGLPTSKAGHNAIAVWVDRFTKYKIFMPVTDTIKVQDFIRLFEKGVLTKHGTPLQIVSDRGSIFTSDLWSRYCKWHGISRSLSTAYHPETDGLTERENKTLGQMLKAYCHSSQSDWDEHLHFAEFAVNTMTNQSTQFSPFLLLHGHEACQALHRLGEVLKQRHEATDRNPSKEDFESRLSQMAIRIQQATNSMKASQLKMVQQANKDRKPRNFEVGDLVAVSTKCIKLPGVHKMKLKPLWVGPFKILSKINENALKIDFVNEYKQAHDVINIGYVKPWPENPSKFDSRTHVITRPDPIVNENGEDEWVVEDILNKRYDRRRKKWLWCVKWKGYTEFDNTWEPYENIYDCAAFERFNEMYPVEEREENLLTLQIPKYGELVYHTSHAISKATRQAISNAVTQGNQRWIRQRQWTNNSNTIRPGQLRNVLEEFAQQKRLYTASQMNLPKHAAFAINHLSDDWFRTNRRK